VQGWTMNYLLDCVRSGQGRQEAADFVQAAYLALLEHGSLLLYCKQGANRSAAAAVAVIKHATGQSMDQIYRGCMAVRPTIRICDDDWEALRRVADAPMDGPRGQPHMRVRHPSFWQREVREWLRQQRFGGVAGQAPARGAKASFFFISEMSFGTGHASPKLNHRSVVNACAIKNRFRYDCIYDCMHDCIRTSIMTALVVMTAC